MHFPTVQMLITIEGPRSVREKRQVLLLHGLLHAHHRVKICNVPGHILIVKLLRELKRIQQEEDQCAAGVDVAAIWKSRVGKKAGKCIVCGSSEHNKDSCPRSLPQPPSFQPTCSRCGGPHLGRLCVEVPALN